MWWGPVHRILKWAAEATSAGEALQAQTKQVVCQGNHAQHICALAAQKNFADIKTMTHNPAYVCANCGRVAGESHNLCNPVRLDSISIVMPIL